MNMDRLLESVKKHEGYRNKVYLDTLGKRTVGVGHLCVEDFWEDDKEYDEKFLLEILEKDLGQAIIGARELMMENDCIDLNEKAEEILEKSNLDIIERIDLKGLEEQHVLFYCKLR